MNSKLLGGLQLATRGRVFLPVRFKGYALCCFLFYPFRGVNYLVTPRVDVRFYARVTPRRTTVTEEQRTDTQTGLVVVPTVNPN
jgi:hypothetical protein